MAEQVNRNDMRCVAFHESGHAVAAVLLDIPFERVYVVRRADETAGYDGMQLGQVVRRLNKPDFAGRLEEAKRQVVQILAGPHGETLAYPNLPVDLYYSYSSFSGSLLVQFLSLCCW